MSKAENEGAGYVGPPIDPTLKEIPKTGYG